MALRRLDACGPIARAPTVVSYGDHDNVLIVHDVDDLVREPTNAYASDLKRWVDAVDG
jgi:hypothetical protein